MANDKLKAVVTCTSRIQLLTEGGWQYSSPLVRQNGGEKIPLLDTSDAISIIALVAGDVDILSRELSTLVDEAKALGFDPIAMCQVDLATQARVYQQLAMDLATASNRAIDGLKQSGQAKPERRRRSNGASVAASQTSLLRDEQQEPETQLGKPGMQSGEPYDQAD